MTLSDIKDLGEGVRIRYKGRRMSSFGNMENLRCLQDNLVEIPRRQLETQDQVRGSWAGERMGIWGLTSLKEPEKETEKENRRH